KPGRPRPLERLRVRPRDHQHVAARPVDDDDGHQPVLVVGQLPGPAEHGAHAIPSDPRTSTPAAASAAFAWPILTSPKWKIDAASAADAWPLVSTSAKCATFPQPPEAITGTFTASATARVSGTSKPSRVPSRSMLVRRISPAPRSAPSRAQATASRPVGVRPPRTYTSHASPARPGAIAS